LESKDHRSGLPERSDQGQGSELLGEFSDFYSILCESIGDWNCSGGGSRSRYLELSVALPVGGFGLGGKAHWGKTSAGVAKIILVTYQKSTNITR